MSVTDTIPDCPFCAEDTDTVDHGTPDGVGDACAGCGLILYLPGVGATDVSNL